MASTVRSNTAAISAKLADRSRIRMALTPWIVVRATVCVAGPATHSRTDGPASNPNQIVNPLMIDDALFMTFLLTYWEHWPQERLKAAAQRVVKPGSSKDTPRRDTPKLGFPSAIRLHVVSKLCRRQAALCRIRCKSDTATRQMNYRPQVIPPPTVHTISTIRSNSNYLRYVADHLPIWYTQILHIW
jgi:hypothetical protein